ncbi:MAG: hypothetical protein V3U27_18735 [Candidatus Tectomicrobia bacterium]
MSQAETEAKVSERFYINQGLAGAYLKIEWNTEDPPHAYEQTVNLDLNALDRLHRFIHLANTLEWSFADLDKGPCLETGTPCEPPVSP